MRVSSAESGASYTSWARARLPSATSVTHESTSTGRRLKTSGAVNSTWWHDTGAWTRGVPTSSASRASAT